MVAETYLIKRLPRRFNSFDYNIPNGVRIKRGSLVKVTFRGFPALGVIKNIKQTSEQKLLDIQKVVDYNFMRNSEIEFYEKIADDVVQSVSTMLFSAFPSPLIDSKSGQTRHNIKLFLPKFGENENDTISAMVKAIEENKTDFIPSCDILQASAIISKFLNNKPSGQTLILAPHSHDADIVAKILAVTCPNLRIFDSRSRASDRARDAHDWRAGKFRVMIATRVGSLLAPRALAHIFVLRTGVNEHAQYARNPRYDARDVAKRLSDATGARLVFMDTAPSVSDTLNLTDEFFTSDFPAVRDARIIDLKNEARGGSETTVSDSVINKIVQTLAQNKKVLLIMNFIEGLATAKKEMTKYFPDAKTVVIKKGSVEISNADIIIATQFYIENIYDPTNNGNIGLVVEVNADIGLSAPVYSNLEEKIRRLYEIKGIAARESAELMIQTWSPDTINSIFSNLKQTLLSDAQGRAKFIYPPFGLLYRIINKADGPEELLNLARDIQNSLQNVVLNSDTGAITVRVKEEDKSKLHAILSKLPDSFIIEVNPKN